MKALRLLLTNLTVLVGLLFVANLLSAVVLDGRRHLYKPLFTEPAQAPEDKRAALPVFAKADTVKERFSELFAMGFDYTPFVGWSRRPFQGAHTTIEESGDRIVPSAPRNPQGTIRFLGGSAMWGTGSNDSETIPSLVAAEFPNHLVLNHAESGFNSRQSLARVINLANQGKALDLVISYDGVNDVSFQCTGVASINGHGREQLIRDRIDRRLRLGPAPDSLQDVHLFRVLLASTYELVLNGYLTIFGQPVQPVEAGDTAAPGRQSLCAADPTFATQVADTLIANWRIAKTVVEAEGGRFLAVLQPVAHLGTPDIDYLDAEGLRAYLKADFLAVYPLLIKQIREERLDWVIDLTDVFDGGQRVYIDDTHVTAEGNRMVAARLKPVIASILGSD